MKVTDIFSFGLGSDTVSLVLLAKAVRGQVKFKGKENILQLSVGGVAQNVEWDHL